MLTSVATRSYILLAESDPNVLYTLTGILEEAGFKVWGVSRFEEARKSLRQREFDAVMTELGLEREGQGLDLAGQAKKLPSSPVVVICAANPTVEKLRAAMSLRVDYVAFKPLDLEEVTSALKRLIARRTDMALA